MHKLSRLKTLLTYYHHLLQSKIDSNDLPSVYMAAKESEGEVLVRLKGSGEQEHWVSPIFLAALFIKGFVDDARRFGASRNQDPATVPIEAVCTAVPAGVRQRYRLALATALEVAGVPHGRSFTIIEALASSLYADVRNLYEYTREGSVTMCEDIGAGEQCKALGKVAIQFELWFLGTVNRALIRRVVVSKEGQQDVKRVEVLGYDQSGEGKGGMLIDELIQRILEDYTGVTSNFYRSVLHCACPLLDMIHIVCLMYSKGCHELINVKDATGKPMSFMRWFLVDRYGMTEAEAVEYMRSQAERAKLEVRPC